RAVNDCLYYFMLKDQLWTPDDVEARAVFAYLESLPPALPEAQPFTVVYAVEDVPQGDAKKGKDVYARACESCHGAVHTGEGRLVPRAPAMPEQVLAEHPSPKYTDQDR